MTTMTKNRILSAIDRRDLEIGNVETRERAALPWEVDLRVAAPDRVAATRAGWSSKSRRRTGRRGRGDSIGASSAACTCEMTATVPPGTMTRCGLDARVSHAFDYGPERRVRRRQFRAGQSRGPCPNP